MLNLTFLQRNMCFRVVLSVVGRAVLPVLGAIAVVVPAAVGGAAGLAADAEVDGDAHEHDHESAANSLKGVKRMQ